MNPIVNTQRDFTQSGMDSALSSTPHGTRSISLRRFGGSRASRMWHSLHQEVVCGTRSRRSVRLAYSLSWGDRSLFAQGYLNWPLKGSPVLFRNPGLIFQRTLVA